VKIKGADDLIVATGATAEDLDALPREDLAPDGPYLVSGGRICRRRQTKDGPVVEHLCNFVAQVTEEMVLDDGAETTRAFMLEGQLDNGPRLPAVRIPASRFPGMAWVTENWGHRAIVRAGMSTRDCLREAIQMLSPAAVTRHVFTHTGWRRIGDQWIYLSASGATGAAGYEVDLGPDLARYALPLHPEQPVDAMRVSLALLRGDIAPAKVMVPLFGAIYRAPTASVLPVDVSVWIEGATGSLKSTIAALALAHYGPFDRLHLPGSWTSTANQLERRAFLLKDAPFVIDDYAPSGVDARELELKAARLLRAAGNGAGRGRLRADLTERPAYPPRGIIVVTGEQHPPGQSILARTLVTELDGGSVNLPALTKAQESAGRLPHAMAGFVGWLAPQMSTIPQLLAEGFAAVRGRAAAGGGHLRVPEALAHLYLGVDLALSYASHIGACSGEEASDLRERAWATLLEISAGQGALILGERPSHRFLKVLLTLLVQGHGVLLDRDTDSYVGRADLLGWQDEESLLLIPEATWHAVTRFCRETGEMFPLREERLRRDLEKEGLSDPDPGRLTATVRIVGRSRRVLRIHRELAEEIVGETFPSPPITGITGEER
jgi:hypothetical protein